MARLSGRRVLIKPAIFSTVMIRRGLTPGRYFAFQRLLEYGKPMNAIGICATVGFFAGFLGAVVAGIRLFPLTKSEGGGARTWDRNDPNAQRVFYRFVGFCAFGVFSSLCGFLFGGWPSDQPADERILWLMILMPILVLAWVAFQLWKLRNVD